MSSTESLGRLTADEATTYLALQVIGCDLAVGIDRVPGTVAIVVGQSAMDLLRGARRVLGPMEPKLVEPHQLPTGTSFNWRSGPPPPDCPVIVFVRQIVTGTTVLALLDQHPRTRPKVPVKVIAAETTPEGVAAIQAQHPTIDARVAGPDLLRVIPPGNHPTRR